MRCSACGYGGEFHEQTGHCPLCACGLLAAEHWPVLDPPAPVAAERHRALWVCPGKPLTAAGKLPTLRRGSFRVPAAAGRTREWLGMTVPVIVAPVDEPIEPVRPPLVPARYTISESEIAPRSMPVGRLAAELGWIVDPWYWKAADGTETSALVMQRGNLRAVAYWNRAPGGSWRTGGASAWPLGSFPASVSLTVLVESIKVMG